MKRRIFTTAALFILATNLIAGTANMNETDSTTILASAVTNNHISEISAGNIVFTSSLNSTNMTNVLEEWIATRKSWEQEGSEGETGNILMEKSNLEEWISGRESWEQESEPVKTEMIETVSLEEWIASRESWEQEGSKTEVTSTSVETDMLKAWVIDRDNWEQK
jgi:hypothetical protein